MIKQAQINQIESIAKKSWFNILKIFLAVFFIKNRLIYFPLYPRVNPKKALFQIIKSTINLGCFAIAIKDFFYIDFFKTWSNSIGCFLSIRHKGIVIHKRYFMPKRYKYLYQVISNNKGIAVMELVNTLSIWFFKIVLCLLAGLVLSLHDIDIPSYQETINNMQYAFKNISILF